MTPLRYPNSVLDTVPSCIFVASIAAEELISASTITPEAIAPTPPLEIVKSPDTTASAHSLVTVL